METYIDATKYVLETEEENNNKRQFNKRRKNSTKRIGRLK